jgi:hypothetical protein
MPALSWVAKHWLRTSIVGLAVAILLAAAGVWYFVLRSPGTPLDLGQALRQYRQEQKSYKASAGAHLPAGGVYQYLTSGGEQLSVAGISRSFPATTNMIVTEVAGCASMKWEPLVQHTEGWVMCPERGGALSITSTPSYEQIAGAQNTTVIDCPPGMYFVPPHPQIGERWQTTCHSPGERVVFSGQVLGIATVRIASINIPALHTRITLVFSGSESGTNPNDFWVSMHDGLILSQHETANFSQSAGPLGSVRYTEQMTIRLTSAMPIR